TGAARSDSEEISVGGTDNVDVTAFEGFDYVALGHIHRAQKCVKDTVRYSGTPLKYSFSEANGVKSVTVLELKAKGEILLDLIPLTPLHDVVEIKGSFEELTGKGTHSEDYMHVTLTDEEEIPDALTKLRVYYKNVMTLDYDNSRTRATGDIDGIENVDSKSPLQLFAEFYEAQNGRELNEEQQEFMLDLINQLWEDWGDVE
ncbi:MAG: exonuclease SbcCD subunit D C-terminal domain-containing protein, partial [Clostridia bacterium]|nr:exonuclease SbcCD subunit D C-terminal domain-containing protein [Clostridia bacterium]